MAPLVKSDANIHADVLDELARDPQVDSTDVGVEVDDGVVTLTGTVDRSVTRLVAERAALRVDGVRAVANTIVVRGPFTSNDTDLAAAVVSALEAHASIPADRIDVTVEHDKVTLRGTVDWSYQVRAVISTVQALTGVRHVVCLLQVKPPEISSSDANVRPDNI
jgi:osmotically-inducible protein OsmY